MKALPSIAFNDFSGTAKDVTARHFRGRTVLTVRPFPSKVVSSSQKTNRNAMDKISRAFKTLTDAQIAGWSALGERLKSDSVLGSSIGLTAHNAFVRLNRNRQMAGMPLLLDAPSHLVSIPNVVYEKIWVTPKTIVFKGVQHERAPYSLVIKMSAGQSAGVSSGWSKTVIVSPGMEDDWGDADVTALYTKALGFKPAVGDKVFFEMYWMDTSTGFTGVSVMDSKICESEEEAEQEGYVKRNKITMDDIKPDSHVSECDVDFSTGAPVISFDTVCLGHSNVASSEAYLEDELPADCVGTSMALARGMGTGNAGLAAQSYIIWLRNSSWDGSSITFAHRGGYYVKPTEVFGPGILY